MSARRFPQRHAASRIDVLAATIGFRASTLVVPSAPEHPASTTPAPDLEPTAVVNLSDALVLKEGGAFLVCLQDGTVPLRRSHPLGLYLDDCRHLSGHELRVGGARPRLLVASATTGADAVHELTNP